MNSLPKRQIHLDFHNSQYLPDICRDFDAERFADTMQKAHVDSVTVFARCIHGMAYYPTKFGQQHPHMNGRDFLGEAIEALHKRGIRAPIYVTITWEEGVAAAHPEWRQMFANGRMATMNTFMNESYVPGSQWKLNDFIHPDYMDYIESYLVEIMDRYPTDGFFLDMLFYAIDAGWSEAARAFREKHGIKGSDREAHFRFETLAQKHFSERMTNLITSKCPDASVFYNTPNNVYLERDCGASARWDHQTHVEVESLPSGIWGYMHFPKIGYRLLSQDKEWLGMTGRFQKMWGDFGGVKPQPALEYECFRTQALGGCNSVGDQLLPTGELDPDAYSLIGAVYRQCQDAEPFYEGSQPLVQVGILSATHPSDTGEEAQWSEEGAVLMFEELRYACAILDDASDWESCEMIVVPDFVRLTQAQTERLMRYRKAGGKLIVSYRSIEAGGLAEALGLNVEGAVSLYPNYWRPATGTFMEGVCARERVFYHAGLEVKPTGEMHTLVDRVEPYFQRDDLKFCSHFQTPPSEQASPYPVLMSGEGLLYFSDPVFMEYRKEGNNFIKDVMARCMKNLLGEPLVSGVLPTVQTYFRRQDNDLIVTLLHYLPVRKAVNTDVVDAALGLGGQVIGFNKEVKSVEVLGAEEGVLQQTQDGAFALPLSHGRLLLKAKGYFA